MPTFAKPLDVYQGYNYKKDKNSPVGFILGIKIGDTQLAADQGAKDPTAPNTTLNAVAVLSHCLWNTGVTDALYFSGQISITNKQNIALLAYKDLTKVEVTVKFVIYDYDPKQKVYFKAFDSHDADLNGILEKNGAELNFSVADDPSTEVQSPINFAFQVGIKPNESAQEIHLSTAQDKSLMKAWGMAVS